MNHYHGMSCCFFFSLAVDRPDEPRRAFQNIQRVVLQSGYEASWCSLQMRSFARGSLLSTRSFDFFTLCFVSMTSVYTHTH